MAAVRLTPASSSTSSTSQSSNEDKNEYKVVSPLYRAIQHQELESLTIELKKLTQADNTSPNVIISDGFELACKSQWIAGINKMLEKDYIKYLPFDNDSLPTLARLKNFNDFKNIFENYYGSEDTTIESYDPNPSEEPQYYCSKGEKKHKEDKDSYEWSYYRDARSYPHSWVFADQYLLLSIPFFFSDKCNIKNFKEAYVKKIIATFYAAIEAHAYDIAKFLIEENIPYKFSYRRCERDDKTTCFKGNIQAKEIEKALQQNTTDNAFDDWFTVYLTLQLAWHALMKTRSDFSISETKEKNSWLPWSVEKHVKHKKKAWEQQVIQFKALLIAINKLTELNKTDWIQPQILIDIRKHYELLSQPVISNQKDFEKEQKSLEKKTEKKSTEGISDVSDDFYLYYRLDLNEKTFEDIEKKAEESKDLYLYRRLAIFYVSIVKPQPKKAFELLTKFATNPIFQNWEPDTVSEITRKIKLEEVREKKEQEQQRQSSPSAPPHPATVAMIPTTTSSTTASLSTTFSLSNPSSTLPTAAVTSEKKGDVGNRLEVKNPYNNLINEIHEIEKKRDEAIREEKIDQVRVSVEKLIQLHTNLLPLINQKLDEQKQPSSTQHSLNR